MIGLGMQVDMNSLHRGLNNGFKLGVVVPLSAIHLKISNIRISQLEQSANLYAKSNGGKLPDFFTSKYPLATSSNGYILTHEAKEGVRKKVGVSILGFLGVGSACLVSVLAKKGG